MTRQPLPHEHTVITGGDVAQASRGLADAMVGNNVDEIPQPQSLAGRGW